MDVKCFFNNSSHGEMRSSLGTSPIILTPGLMVTCYLVGIEIEIRMYDVAVIGTPDTGFYKLELRQNDFIMGTALIPFENNDQDTECKYLGMPCDFDSFMQSVTELMHEQVVKQNANN